MILQFGALFSGLGSSLLQQGLSFGTSFLEEKLGKKKRRRRRRRRREPPEDEGIQAGQRSGIRKPKVPVTVAAGILPQTFLPAVVKAGAGVFAASEIGSVGIKIGQQIGESIFGPPDGIGGQRFMPDVSDQSMSQREAARVSRQKWALNPNGTLQTFSALRSQGIEPQPPFYRIGRKKDGSMGFIIIRRRRMNPLNFKALMRANRRVEGFEGIIKRNFTFSKPATPKSKKRIVRRRKRRKAAC